MTERVDYPIGLLAMMPEKETCHCGDGTPHRHAYEVIWNGSSWVRRQFSEEVNPDGEPRQPFEETGGS